MFIPQSQPTSQETAFEIPTLKCGELAFFILEMVGSKKLIHGPVLILHLAGRNLQAPNQEMPVRISLMRAELA